MLSLSLSEDKCTLRVLAAFIPIETVVLRKIAETTQEEYYSRLTGFDALLIDRVVY